MRTQEVPRVNQTELDRIVAHVRKVVANEGSIRCGICAREVSGLAAVCSQCEAPCHTDCWDYNGGCAVYGCKAAPRDPVPVDLGKLDVPPPIAGRRIAYLLTAVSLAAGAFTYASVMCPSFFGACYKPGPSSKSMVRVGAPVARATANFTIRVGGPIDAGKPAPREVALETKILVVDSSETAALKLTPGPLAHPLGLTYAELNDRVAEAEKRGTVRTVASPRLISLEGRDTFVRVGKRLMFTGRPDAEREAGSLEIVLRPSAVRDDGVSLALNNTAVDAAYGEPQLLHFSAMTGDAPAFWERHKLADRGEQWVAVIVIPHRSEKPTAR